MTDPDDTSGGRQDGEGNGRERRGSDEAATTQPGGDDATAARPSDDVGTARPGGTGTSGEWAPVGDPEGAPRRSLPDPEWPVVESVVEYDTSWYTGGYDLVEQPDGSRKRYYWASLPPAVVVVAVADGSVVAVEQYRPVIRHTQLELPAGIVEAGESYTGAGARELREETGFDPDGVSLLGEVHVSTGVLRHRRGYVFAEALTPVGQDLDGNEFLDVRAVPADDVLDRLRERPTNDATVQGLMLASDAGLL